MFSTLRRSLSSLNSRIAINSHPWTIVRLHPTRLESLSQCPGVIAFRVERSNMCTQESRQLARLENSSRNQLAKYNYLPATESNQKNRYTGFATKREEKASKFKTFYLIFITGWLIFVLGFGGLQKIFKLFKIEAAAPEVDNDSAGDESGVGHVSDEVEDEKSKKKKVSFRDRKIIEYENRIRQYSTPDKIFRYFATLKLSLNGDSEVYMTPDDFVRSITPGSKQPEGLGLDKFRKFDPKVKRGLKDKLESELGKDSMFFKLGEMGLISFTDYVLLLTIMSTPHRLFELAFKMFDYDGNGTLEYSEYERVQSILRSQTAMGSRHRDHSTTGSVVHATHSALSKYFFGQKLDQKLSFDRFQSFVTQLEQEILKMEFDRYEPENNVITERQFSEVLILHAGFADAKRQRMLKRVKKRFSEEGQGITFEEYMNFCKILKNINDIDTALTFYHVAGASIDQATFKHVARTATNVDLTDHVVNVVFTLFDENNDGQLSNKEFVSVMKQRLMRGLEKPKELGFVKLMNSIYKCARNQVPSIFD